MKSTNKVGIIVPTAPISLDSSDQKHPPDNFNKDIDKKSNSFLSSSPSIAINSEVDEKPNIPDGGWGWVVVFATFVLCMIADGITFSFGLLYTEFLEEFQASISATSWIGSLFVSVPLLTGPIMSALVDKYGCRSMTILGGIISASGFILSSKCHSLSLMYLTFGVLAGLGIGLIFVTLVVSVAFWFDKKLNLAIGISSAGLGMGTFVFSPFTLYLLTEYGWRGTTLILGGCLLNMCVCGTLMRNPDWIIERNRRNSKSILNKPGKPSGASGVTSAENQPNVINVEETKSLLTSESDANTLFTNPEITVDRYEDRNKLRGYFLSEFDLPTFMRECGKENYKKKNEPLVYRRNTFHGGVIFNTNKHRLKVLSCPDIYKDSMVSAEKNTKKKWYSDILDLMRDICDYSLFLELHFFLLSLSTVIMFAWFVVPYFYLATLMEQFGYTKEQASFCLSKCGIASTVGMIFFGWAGDRPWMNITKTYAISTVVCGVSVAGQMLFIENYVVLDFCVSLFAFSLSSHFAFLPGILVELAPLNRFTIAYGLQLLCQGIGTLIGPPYAGLLFDMTHSWEQTFYQAGIWLVISGIFIGFIPYIKNRKMIGKGPVEKEIEGSENKLLPLLLISIFLILSLAIAFYLTGKSMQAYLRS